MDTGDHLLRAILEGPADDAPRLIYADWLEEHGEAARAEFIRVQVELATYNQYPQKCECERFLEKQRPCPYCRLLKREDELFDLDGCSEILRWFGLPQPWARIVRTTPFQRQPDDYPYAIVRRGFIEEVEARTESFLHAAAMVFAAQPVTDVRLMGNRPLMIFSPRNGGVWTWQAVPFDLMGGTMGVDFRTQEDGRAAMSRACVAHGRKLAGLPPLPPLMPPTVPPSDSYRMSELFDRMRRHRYENDHRPCEQCRSGRFQFQWQSEPVLQHRGDAVEIAASWRCDVCGVFLDVREAIAMDDAQHAAGTVGRTSWL